MRWKSAFVLVFVMFFIGLTSASFTFSEIGSETITQYESSNYLQAGINISFLNESLNSNITDSLGNSIMLRALLIRNPEYDYIYNDLSNETINSAFQIIDMSKAQFIMPRGMGNISYKLFLNENKFLEKTLQIMSTQGLLKKEIDKAYTDLNATKKEIATYDPFVQKALNEYLNISSVEKDLKEVETQYANANVSGYTEVLNNLSNVKIPKDVSESVNTNSISFYPNRAIINLDVIQAIGGGEYGDSESYIDSIYSWNEKNLKTTVTFMEIVINYGVTEQTKLRIFQFNFDKRNMKDNAYFIIEKIENLKFEDSSYQVKETDSGYDYIDLKDVTDTITFSTTQDVDFIDVPAFISPSLDHLSPVVIEKYPLFNDNPTSKWIFFGIIVFIVLLIGMVTYILLQRWYRRKYENYLFKNRNNLYNIMTYIQNAKKKAMPRDEIIKNLKKADWTGEQIRYALNKYEGKKIAGIIERPFHKVMQELERSPLEIDKKPDQNINNFNNARISESKSITKNENKAEGSEKKVKWVLTLVMSILFGGLGVDRFIMGQVGLGIIKLITLGGLGIWWLIDVILIATKHKFKGIEWE